MFTTKSGMFVICSDKFWLLSTDGKKTRNLEQCQKFPKWMDLLAWLKAKQASVQHPFQKWRVNWVEII